MRILAGDVGGTHTRLIYLDDDAACSGHFQTTFASARYSSLEPIIDEFISRHAFTLPFDAVSLAVAGPVMSGRAAITNLPWEVSTEMLSKQLKTKTVYLLNDLAAAAYALPILPAEQLVLVNPGAVERPGPQSNAVVVAPGTGLGAAYLAWLGDRQVVFSSEAGHAGFAPATAEQEQLLTWMQQQCGRVSVEMLLSGRGIFMLYRFFRDALGESESPLVREQIKRATDPAPVISQHALAADDPLSVRTLTCFVEILGSVTGDIALHYFPLDAIYLAGGIVPKIQALLTAQHLLTPLVKKGPMQTYLERLPVVLITKETAGIDGAVAYARQQAGLAAGQGS
ncbi:glucokinase [Sedimenticola sp.]|uniref:glucokinase n=1 Tax=Sedimenticola sp. TaxID=1940285 RepID=UPI003D0E3D24